MGSSSISEGCSFFAGYAHLITVGDDVWIGGGVRVMPGVTIGNNVVIGDGSIVAKDVPSGVVVAGNPCRMLRRLDWRLEHRGDSRCKNRRSGKGAKSPIQPSRAGLLAPPISRGLLRRGIGGDRARRDEARLREADPDGLCLFMLEDCPCMMTPDHVAAFTGTTSQEIRKLLCRGDMRGCRIGIRWFIPKPGLLNCLYKDRREKGGDAYEEAPMRQAL